MRSKQKKIFIICMIKNFK